MNLIYILFLNYQRRNYYIITNVYITDENVKSHLDQYVLYIVISIEIYSRTHVPKQ